MTRALLLLIGLSAAARADETPGAAEFDRGMQLYRSGDCTAAVDSLEQASRAAPRPSALMALGFCYRQAKKFAKATDAYQRYLQLHADDEKRVVFLLEDTLQEEREWRREHPEEPKTELPSAPPIELPPPRPAAKVSLDADEKAARLQQLAGTLELSGSVTNAGGYRFVEGTAREWRDLCAAPCGVAVPLDVDLRIGGEGFTPSATFHLPQGKAAITVKARVGSADRRNAGKVSLMAGGVAMLFSGGLFIGAAMTDPPTSGPFADPVFADQNASRASVASGLRIAGGVGLALGLIGLVSGLALYNANDTEVAVR